ncbi:MAG: carbohydrate kinase family protein [Hadesarchaea archaeon]|nr:carbohydrate kinase family protein [Hadesarchaea archaeon]
MMKILAIGDVNVDLILPLCMPKIGKQVAVDDFQAHGGGCAANFALACAKLGAKSKLVGRVADDVFGESVLKELNKHGVDTRDVVVSRGGKTGVTVAPGPFDRRTEDPTLKLKYFLKTLNQIHAEPNP